MKAYRVSGCRRLGAAVRTYAMDLRTEFVALCEVGAPCLLRPSRAAAAKGAYRLAVLDLSRCTRPEWRYYGECLVGADRPLGR
jgi:hypothetical protein